MGVYPLFLLITVEKRDNSFQFFENWKELHTFVPNSFPTIMIENPPLLTSEELLSAFLQKPTPELSDLLEKIQQKYEYWDTVKYKKTTEGISSEKLWAYVKATRKRNEVSLWERYGVKYSLTSEMQRICHEMDMNYGGSWMDESATAASDRQRFLIHSLMEEAISSSMMEGASTTRRVAKEMLKKNTAPKDVSQQMIVNNYQTIRFIVENKDTPLTPELLLFLHRQMTEKTLSNMEDEGKFRESNEVVVANGITNEVVHTPPPFSDIPQFVEEFCQFFNAQEHRFFVHPIIRGILLHFMISYVHPFVDGNGRTARALFYWYMLKNGYWLTQYLSISEVIYKNKVGYEKAFLYAEADGLDIGYFITYHLKVLTTAFQNFQAYLERQKQRKESVNVFLNLEINDRQADILYYFSLHPQHIFTIKELQQRYGVTPTTAKSDVVGLMERGWIKEMAFNKVKKGYRKGEAFDEMQQSLKNFR